MLHSTSSAQGRTFYTAGVSVPDVTVASQLPGTEGQTAEDFWTPEVAPVPGGLNEDPPVSYTHLTLPTKA